MTSKSRFTDDEYQGLFRYAVALCGCRQKGFDVLHESLLAWSEREQVDVQNPVAYLKRMIRNKYFDQLKQGRRQQELLDVHGPEIGFGDEDQLEQLMIDRLSLERIWQNITAQERELLYLWAVEGYTAREIGLQLNMPRATVLSKMHRMRLRLQSDFSGERSQL